MERHDDAVSSEKFASLSVHSKTSPAPAIDVILRHMAETVREVFWLSTPDLQTLLYANPAFERVWGQPRAAALQPPAAIVHAAHPDDFSRVFKEILSVRETPRDIDYRIVRPDGTIRWVRNRVHGIYDGGRLAMLAGKAADITEHKLFQKALIDSHARFITVLDGIDADIYVADMDTHEIRFANRHIRESFGPDLIGKSEILDDRKVEKHRDYDGQQNEQDQQKKDLHAVLHHYRYRGFRSWRQRFNRFRFISC